MPKIALASPPIIHSLTEALDWVLRLTKEAAQAGAVIVCFPESMLPGYPGMGFPPEDREQTKLEAALKSVCRAAKENNIGVILPMDWQENGEWLNVAQVIEPDGSVAGYQAKNQLDPSEDNIWASGRGRRLFTINNIRFGISICHEGFRYPETVRWAARQGASIVFHPHFAGSDTEGPVLTEWGAAGNPYYEKAMLMRSIENTIYFASVNYSSRFPESASAVIAPDGTCIAHAEYGKAGVLIADIEPSLATGFLAGRLKAAW